MSSTVVGDGRPPPAGGPGGWLPGGRRDGGADGRPPASRLTAARRRRSVPHLAIGALLVVVCALGAVVAAGRLGDRLAVLALAHPVAAGHLLAIGDVRAVEVAADAGLDLVPAAASETVLGRPIGYALPAGALLTRAVLGPAQVPVAGDAVAAVGLRPGQFPPDLQSGARVAVLVAAGTDQAATSGSGGGPAAGSSWTGVVVGVEPNAGSGDQVTVVSLRLPEADARAVAAAPAGRLALVVLGGGG